MPEKKNSGRKKISKTYVVNVDVRYSFDFTVRATSIVSAEKIALERFNKKKLKRSDVNIGAELQDDFNRPQTLLGPWDFKI